MSETPDPNTTQTSFDDLCQLPYVFPAVMLHRLLLCQLCVWLIITFPKYAEHFDIEPRSAKPLMKQK